MWDESQPRIIPFDDILRRLRSGAGWQGLMRHLRMGSPPSGLSRLVSGRQLSVHRQCYQPWVPMHMGVTLTDRRPPSRASTPQNHAKVEFAASPLANYAASAHAPSHHAAEVYPDDHISATLPAGRYKE